MKRGEIWWIELSPLFGGKVGKMQPAIILSNNTFNKIMSRIQVIPMTTRIGTHYPTEVYLEVEGKPYKAMIDQLATINTFRLKSKIGQVSEPTLLEIERALKIQLDL
jgi:mRNA interferase MazF